MLRPIRTVTHPYQGTGGNRCIGLERTLEFALLSYFRAGVTQSRSLSCVLVAARCMAMVVSLDNPEEVFV